MRSEVNEKGIKERKMGGGRIKQD